jgi:general secretion pathway protein D
VFPSDFIRIKYRPRCELNFIEALRVRNMAAVIVASSILFGCTFIKADSCADQANLPKSENIVRGCEGSFFSAQSQRDAVYQGDDSARLWAGAEYRQAPNIDVSKINQAPSGRAGITAWSESLRVDISDDENVIKQDIENIKVTSTGKFDPDEKVTVKFEKASLDFFLKQMLGGALGVSYVAPDDLTGSVTFRTEQPILKSQVLQVVRDVLARNGLEMRYMSGVYQIGTPDMMTSLQQTTGPGRLTDQATRVIGLHKGKADEVIAFVKQLLPDDVTLVSASGRDSIIVKASPDEIEKISELISMSDGGLSDDRVAIIPLAQSAPEKIARQLEDFYRSRAEPVTVIPLDNQQALLVGTKDRRTLRGIKELVTHLDRDTGGDSTLRIIPLVNVGAEEVVPLLTSIFTNGGGGPVTTPGYGPNPGNQGPVSQTNVNQTITSSARVQQNNINSTAQSNGNQFREVFDVLGVGNNNGSANSSGPTNSNGPANNNSPANSAPPNGNGIEQISGQAVANIGPAVKFVADTRNNAVMVYSSYAVYKLVKERLKVLDVPQAQVVIEAAVAEVTLNDQLSHGVEAFLTSSNVTASSSKDGTLPVNDGGGFVHVSFGAGAAKADIILKALQAITDVKIISTPYLTVIDGKKARLQIGDQVPFQTTTSTIPTTGTPLITQTVEVKDTGVVLEITPRIRPNNAVVLDINQSVSQVKDDNTTNQLTPTISTRQVQSDVLIQSGSTIMLGGLIQEKVTLNETGLPIARNIPIVGDLFKQRSDTGLREELIILITPRVVRHSVQLENITRQMRALVHIR